jgi:hypothetical protein
MANDKNALDKNTINHCLMRIIICNLKKNNILQLYEFYDYSNNITKNYFHPKKRMIFVVFIF